MTPDELRIVAAACQSVKRGTRFSAMLSDLPEAHPVRVLAELRSDSGAVDMADAHGELCREWARLTGRETWVGDLLMFPVRMGERFLEEALKMDPPRPAPSRRGGGVVGPTHAPAFRKMNR